MNVEIGFSEKEYLFIEKEFGYSREDVDKFSKDELSDLQDECSNIEIDAIIEAGDNRLSEEGNTASDIVTKIGNIFYDVDDEEDDEEDSSEAEVL